MPTSPVQTSWPPQKAWTPPPQGSAGAGSSSASKWGQKTLASEVATDFEVDRDARYTGTVKSYYKWGGYGFIEPAQSGLVPNDKLYVHWSNIQTDDRVPMLVKDMQVEFGLMKYKVGSKTTLRAKGVTMPGGTLVAVLDEADAKNKEFVGDQSVRYTGTLKFYDPRRGYGYVIMDDGYDLPEPVPKELKVLESEVNCGGKAPRKKMEKMQVEFSIWKNRKGEKAVYNMTLPGGRFMTVENLENRQALAGMFKGVIHSWNWMYHWGLIQLAPNQALPPAVSAWVKEEQAKDKDKETLVYFRKTDISKNSPPKSVRKGAECAFQFYTDDKGIGAHEIVAEPAAA